MAAIFGVFRVTIHLEMRVYKRKRGFAGEAVDLHHGEAQADLSVTIFR